MSIFRTYLTHIHAAIAAAQAQGALAEGLALNAVTAEPPRDASHGCISTNAAMVLAKPAGKAPRDVAAVLAESLKTVKGVAAVDVAGPGFINLRLEPQVWLEELAVILGEKSGYGDSTLGQHKTVNVEYVSANPTGPMHIGHARGAVVGDALASLLQKAGYQVTREYYTNDAGGQVEVLARSSFLRYREALGEEIGEIPAGLYPGDYLVPLGQALAKEYGDALKAMPEAEWLPICKDKAITAMMAMIKDDLAALGVKHDVFASEKEVIASGKVEEAIATLASKGLIYQGVLEPPKGKAPEDWEPRPQTLFKSSQFGDDTDRPIQKSDGSWTYFAPDIAYHYDKYKRGHDLLIDILGADHGGYVKRVKAVVTALTDGKGSCEVLLCQLVKLMRGGEPFKMSKRAGTFVTLRDVVDLVGKDVLRFIMLTRKNDAALEFDVDQVQEQSKDNPVFYVQYAHARCQSILRHMQEQCPEALVAAQKPEANLLGKLAHPEVLSVVKLLASWPRVVEQAAAACEPHRLVFFVQELAAAFHGLWNQGNQDAVLRFIQLDNKEQTAAYAVFVQAVAFVLASGLECVGVTPVKEM